MEFEDKYFKKFEYLVEQVEKYFENAEKDLNIAKKDEFLDVRFNYAYTSLLKAGIALLGYNNVKVRSVPGHHVKLIEKMSDILKDETISDVGNAMRMKRNFGIS